MKALENGKFVVELFSVKWLKRKNLSRVQEHNMYCEYDDIRKGFFIYLFFYENKYFVLHCITCFLHNTFSITLSFLTIYLCYCYRRGSCIVYNVYTIHIYTV